MKAQPIGWRYAILVLALAFLAMLVMDFNNRMSELRRLSADREMVEAELSGQKQTQAYLETRLAYATSEAAVIEWGYQDGHMVRPGDVPVVPLPAGEITPTPAPTPEVVFIEPERSTWEEWLALFFGPKAP